ncbi:hypothetical protein CIPAW_03G060600 [Carya illinoinensis]|uniref:Uncharacterized protein n=1 Tax=Carya illinoinensis TaxID=32201 RepID=A0A8T1QZA9_CARIL|nr:hypothetical protein CIPAW_03G060600 [Carya illinoinensis]
MMRFVYMLSLPSLRHRHKARSIVNSNLLPHKHSSLDNPQRASFRLCLKGESASHRPRKHIMLLFLSTSSSHLLLFNFVFAFVQPSRASPYRMICFSCKRSWRLKSGKWAFADEIL